MAKPIRIMVQKPRPPKTCKLTIAVDGEILKKAKAKININYSYVFEQILDHIITNGIEKGKPLSLLLIRPEDVDSRV